LAEKFLIDFEKKYEYDKKDHKKHHKKHNGIFV